MLPRSWLFQALATSTSPISPERMISIARRHWPVERLCVPTCTMRLFRLAASITSRPSRTLCDIGFST
jgi:hypothetical protein